MESFVSRDSTVDILGIEVSRLPMGSIIDLISASIEKAGKLFVAAPNVFCITKAKKDVDFKMALASANIVVPDGMPLVWASYILGKKVSEKVCGPDLFQFMNLRAAERGYTSYFLGGGPGGSERVVHNLRCRLPALKTVGNFSPPFGDLSNKLTSWIINDINSCSPNILWVGLGSPRQEKWIANNFLKLNARFAMGVGAAFYYAAGIKKRPPRWMQKTGLEWSYRIFIQDFSLLWRKRYYAFFHEFMMPVLIQAINQRHKKHSG